MSSKKYKFTFSLPQNWIILAKNKENSHEKPRFCQHHDGDDVHVDLSHVHDLLCIGFR